MTNNKSDDSFCEAFLQKPNTHEALSWLKNKRWTERNIGELNHRDSLAVVRTLYKLGAKLVVAVDLDEEIALSETCDSLVVVLPPGIRSRRQVVQWCSGHSVEQGFDPIVDEGQRYVFLWWD
jgi:hypothetical protein